MIKYIPVLMCSLMLLSGCGAEVDEIMSELETAQLSQDQPLEDTTRLEAIVELGVGSLDISRGREEELYDLRIDYTGPEEEPTVDFERSGDSATLKVQLEGKSGSGWWHDENRIDLEFSPKVDLDATFITGVGDNQVDLTGLKIQGLEIVNGVGNTEINMDDGNQVACETVNITNGIGHLEMTGIGNLSFSDFNFTGGIGDSTLDFSGAWNKIGEIEIKVGLGSLEVMLPEDIDIRIKTSKSFLSNVQAPGFEQVGNEYRSGDVENSERVLLIRLNTGMGSVRFQRD